MIERISVRDFILVDHLDLEFGPGLTCLSGETGAGKSILVGAISVLFGAKANPDMVRQSAVEAQVSGWFRVPAPKARDWLAARDITPEDGAVLVRRTIKPTGRGSIYIQRAAVTRADLGEFAALLIDLHGQHAHQSLFSEAGHRNLLDRYAGVEAEVDAFEALFRELATSRDALADAQSRVAERERETELLHFALEEIAALALGDGEVAALEAERARLAQFERLAEHVTKATALLEDEESGGSIVLTALRTALEAAARIDPQLEALARRGDSVAIEVEDVRRSLAEYRAALEFDPARLEWIEARLAEIRRVERKYLESDQDLAEYHARAQRNLATLEASEESHAALRAKIAELNRTIAQRAAALHQARVTAAVGLERGVAAILGELAMGAARFKVEVETRTGDTGALVCGPRGADRIRFLISANPGVPPRPLQQIASGGEISRVMLAIKSVLAEADEIGSLIFDEIDTGVGGAVAVAMARHLAALARVKQVICITHLATIAVQADNHIVVQKTSDGTTTHIRTANIAGDDRVEEIARMLSGDSEGASSLSHARALIDAARRS